MNDEARLIEIEEKIAHLEKYVGDLNEVIGQNAAELAAMRKLLGRVTDRVGRIENPPEERTLEEDRPPHW
ncbi:MAG: SlyX family protein [Phycisphaerales bacterium]